MEPFGSFVSNLFSRWGDLDISIQLANGLFISSSGKKQRQKLLRDLMKAMRQRGRLNLFLLIILVFTFYILLHIFHLYGEILLKIRDS